MKPSRKAREEVGGKSFDGFSLPPHGIVVIGVDTQDGAEHPLYSQRAVDLANGLVDYDDRMYRSIRAKGVLQAIRVRLEQSGDRLVHVVVAGRHRVLYGRRVVSEMFAAGEIGDMKSWQIKCTLEHARTSRELVEVVADENVCRRVLGDDEIAEGIQRGVNIGLTIEEMAERFNLTMSKAKRLLARAEGVPEKPAKPKVERVPSKAVSRVANKLALSDNASRQWYGSDIACLIRVAMGKTPLSEATWEVQKIFREAAE